MRIGSDKEVGLVKDPELRSCSSEDGESKLSQVIALQAMLIERSGTLTSNEMDFQDWSPKASVYAKKMENVEKACCLPAMANHPVKRKRHPDLLPHSSDI
jgi:hypothetical protein